MDTFTDFCRERYDEITAPIPVVRSGIPYGGESILGLPHPGFTSTPEIPNIEFNEAGTLELNSQVRSYGEKIVLGTMFPVSSEAERILAGL